MLQLKNVVKEYKLKKSASVTALKGVNLTLQDRGLTFILGKSGCGKTTLLNVLGGLDDFDSGEITLDGKDFRSLGPQELTEYRNRYVGFIFQEYNLIDDFSVGKNIAIALQLQGREDKDLVSEVLTKVGLDGYENRKIAELSGGQKQRVAIARAIVKNPKLILADEPTGNLDSVTSQEILELLKELSKYISVVVVSHDAESAEKYADVIVKMKDGEVTEVIEQSTLVLSPTKPFESEQNRKKKGLKPSAIFKMAFGGMKKRFVRLTLCILTLMLCLSCIGLAFAATYNDTNKIFLKACDKYNQHSVTVQKIENYSDDASTSPIAQNLNAQDVAKVGEFVNGDYISVHQTNIDVCDYANGYVASLLSRFSLCGPSKDFLQQHGYEIVYGKYPIHDDEVMIPSVLYEIFKRTGYYNADTATTYPINEMKDMIGKPIGQYEVVGIVDTRPNLNVINQFFEAYDKDPQAREVGTLLADFSFELYDTIHSALFVSEDCYKYRPMNKLSVSFVDSLTFNYDFDKTYRYEDVREETASNLFVTQCDNQEASVILPYGWIQTWAPRYLSIDVSALESIQSCQEILSNNKYYIIIKTSNAPYYSIRTRLVGTHNIDNDTIIINDKVGEELSKNTLPVIGMQVFLSNSYKENEKLLAFLETTFDEEDTTYRYVPTCGFWNNVERMLRSKYIGWMPMFGGIGTIVAIIATLMIWNFTYTTILDSKKSVGILISLGAKKSAVSMIFVIEAIFIWITSNLLSYTLIPLYRYIFGDVSNCIKIFNYAPRDVLTVLIYSLVVILIGSISTIYKFLRQKPIDIIRRT
ncbi:MAG: ATP-binding cassette domain-containing protein [Christensenellales bacterium]